MKDLISFEHFSSDDWFPLIWFDESNIGWGFDGRVLWGVKKDYMMLRTCGDDDNDYNDIENMWQWWLW
jgi:hypothetical protein